jgi:DNA-binding transcriptional ArsR family regulator
MVLPVVDNLSPQEVALIAGKHSSVQEAEKDVIQALKDKAIPYKVVHVDDWDIVAWNNAITAALDRLKDERITVNLTAGHGLAVAMLAIHAAQRALPVACFDWEPDGPKGRAKTTTGQLHSHSPAAVLHLKDTQEIDRRILRLLVQAPQQATAVVTKLDVPQSTASTALARLAERGFVDRDAQGRTVTYRLREGLQPMIAQALGEST